MHVSLFVPLALAVVVGSGFFGAGVWHVLEANIVYPAPYEHDLRECLKEARVLDDRAKVEVEENICFRKYPHFN